MLHTGPELYETSHFLSFIQSKFCVDGQVGGCANQGKSYAYNPFFTSTCSTLILENKLESCSLMGLIILIKSRNG